MKKTDLYKKILHRFGLEHQIRKLQEEACELGAAVNHYLCDRNNGEAHFYEELADVQIVVEQLIPYLDKKKLNQAKTRKLRRLKKRYGK